ncbi:PEP/pyruvate-binding domain-containing protein [Paenibacillus sp. S150]|uniref:PEP/pyruvate-binding domain-containing protein n=1 Tax=Paenibacillus sp. S150 TaxID=2749826 RepID=UPI001C5889FC|nr:PEP/pyruvate-binding domain-containing protein [Paenibacillus sp. S150]MBW4082410.1 hypothetical protein [Paenibacillus sp. S150]
MSYICSLNPSLEPVQTGHKFANLGRISGLVQVPEAICITQAAFQDSISEELTDFLEVFFEELKATVGCFLLSTYPQLKERIVGLALAPSIETELNSVLVQHFGSLEGRKFAVRSSGATEDSGQFSFAGVYETLLNVEGLSGIIQAIAACWSSYYSYAAVAARIRANQFSAKPDMALIIQEMVPSEYSGVAFTQPSNERVVIEYVKGLGDQMVSGTVTPWIYSEGEVTAGSNQMAAILQDVKESAGRLAGYLNYPVDIEWAWASNTLYILQVRPITAKMDNSEQSQPLCMVADLYGNGPLPLGMELGDCREVYTSYVTKRASSYRLAISHGVQVAGAYVMYFNGAGLLKNTGILKDLLGKTPIGQVVLDISSNIRQVVLEKEQVYEYLKDTFALTQGSYHTHTIIIRDFIQGEFGFISRRIGEQSEGVLIEYSKDGLMNINRGIAGCERIVVGSLDAVNGINDLIYSGDADEVRQFYTTLPIILRFTKLVNDQLPGTQLEWVLEKGLPYFIDYSREMDEVIYNDYSGSTVISAGTAEGPLYPLVDDQMLYRLSIGPAVSVDKTADVLEHAGLQALIHKISSLPRKPIIYAQRPYAILSTLFEHVSGFIFSEGSLLCHLAILLRESRIPSAINSEFSAEEGAEVFIADGLIHLPQEEGILRNL